MPTRILKRNQFHRFVQVPGLNVLDLPRHQSSAIFRQEIRSNGDAQHEDSEHDWVHIDRKEGSLCSYTRPVAASDHHDMTPYAQEMAHDRQQATIMEQQNTPSQETVSQETPSRHELLSIVRKHSTFLKNSAMNDINKELETNLDSRFWREMVDMFFVRGLDKLKSPQDDDLVFFVYHKGLKKDISKAPYFVRRWASELTKVIGDDDSKEVDWQRSFYLNLIAHTSYTLTVAIFRREALQNRQKNTSSSISPIYLVSKTVYASPSRVNFQTDMSKGFETVPAYPDIFFMVDDYDDTFEEVILVEPDHCYCVFLNADGGAAFSKEELDPKSSKRTSPESDLLWGPQNFETLKLTLFSGFVGYEMVRSAFEGGRSRIGGLLLMGSTSAQSERLLMHGPGGRGEVDVSVSGVPDENAQPPLSSHRDSKSAKIGSMMRKAAVAASLAAKHAYVGSMNASHDLEALPLRCCLMSLTLPWDVLAYDLLFKDLPKDEK